jgi:hypothetical protein
MRKHAMRERAHAAEPKPGSFRAVTGDGGDADLFNLNHYPVHAVCRVCSQPICAEAFLIAFRHGELLSPQGERPPVPPGVRTGRPDRKDRDLIRPARTDGGDGR